MVIDINSIDQINTALILIQRRIDRIVNTLDKFTDELKACQSVEDIKKLTLKINDWEE